MSPLLESEKDSNYKINQLKFDLSRGNDKLDLIMQAISKKSYVDDLFKDENNES